MEIDSPGDDGSGRAGDPGSVCEEEDEDQDAEDHALEQTREEHMAREDGREQVQHLASFLLGFFPAYLQ